MEEDTLLTAPKSDEESSLQPLSAKSASMDLSNISDEELPAPASSGSDTEAKREYRLTPIADDIEHPVVDPNEVLDLLTNIDQELDNIPDEPPQETPATLQQAKEKPEAIKMMFNNFIKTEKLYYTVLFCLKMFFNAVVNYATDEQNSSIIQDNIKLYGKIPEIIKFHGRWLETLESPSGTQDENSLLTTFLVDLRTQFLLYKAHALNYPASTEILHKFWVTKGLGDIIPKSIDTQEIKMTFEEALQRPSTRMSDYYSLLDDLLKYTPRTSEYFPLLEETREELSIFFEIIKISPKDKKVHSRHIVKWSALVEEVNGEVRKHRIFMLLTDYVVCVGESSKSSYSLKWYCSLTKLKLMEDIHDPKLRGPEFVPLPKIIIDNLREEVVKIQEELASHDERKNSKKADKLKKTLNEKMSELVLKYPSFPLYLYMADGKRATLLFMSDANRKAWERLIRIRKNSGLLDTRPIYIGELNEAIDCVRKKIEASFRSSIQNCLLNTELQFHNESSGALSRFTGRLFVVVKLYRYDPSQFDIVFNVELDKHIKGYKANSKNSKIGATHSESFFIDLNNSHGYLYITCARSRNKPSDALGAFVINLATEDAVNKPFIRKKKAMKWGEVVVFLEFSTSATEAQYITKYNPLNPSIQKIAESEALEVPSIVPISIKFIEERGLDEIGIYRVCGTTSKVTLLTQIWSDGFIFGAEDLDEFDVNVVAGNFKQLFRELHEPIIPVAVLKKLIPLDFSTVTREEFMNIISELPQANKKVLIMILDHLLVVQAHESSNKMTFQNISTVFGVNIFRLPNNPDPSCNGFSLDMNDQITTFTSLLAFWKKTKLGDEDVKRPSS